MPEFKNKFVAFIDILGFKQMVAKSESGAGMSLDQIIALLETFGTPAERQKYEQYGPFCCPESLRVEKHIDFRLTQISDCAVISTEISPAGAINLISFCWGVAIKFLQYGILCRGHITRGQIHHTADQFIGTGYQTAVEAEPKVSVFQRNPDDKGTPFVEVDRDLCTYIHEYGDSCVKEMFSRMTRGDGDAVALFPFKRLEHSFLIAGFGKQFNPDKEKQANENVRKTIKGMKDKVLSFMDTSNPKAMLKIEHYIAALDVQLEVCDKTDEFIDKLSMPYPARSF